MPLYMEMSQNINKTEMRRFKDFVTSFDSYKSSTEIFFYIYIYK